MSRKLIAAALSGLACPGAGQLYNRQRIKGWILISAALGMLAAAAYKTWAAALDVVASMPPERVFDNIFGLADKVLEANRAFYDWSGFLFLVIWVYGMIDAYIYAKKRIN